MWLTSNPVTSLAGGNDTIKYEGCFYYVKAFEWQVFTALDKFIPGLFLMPDSAYFYPNLKFVVTYTDRRCNQMQKRIGL